MGKERMNPITPGVAYRQEAVLATNSLIRNTYILLSLTLLFSAFTAALSMALLSIFALTGFMGLTLGPIISFYLTQFSNGSELVMMAMGGTAVIFLGLSGYALTTRKDFSFMGGFLMVGILVAFLAGLGAVIFSIPALMLAVSSMFILLMAGLILYQTSAMVHGGETNYIMATITLYVSIFNLFTSLLHLLGFSLGED
jgi:modulator of FtsH protease